VKWKIVRKVFIFEIYAGFVSIILEKHGREEAAIEFIGRRGQVILVLIFKTTRVWQKHIR
jgi:hypothetical protein